MNDSTLTFRAAVLALMLTSGAAAADVPQAAGKPQFDAASIKPNPSPSLRHVLLPPNGGRLNTRMAPLRLLIQNAYAVQSFEIFGGPDWIGTAGFDLEATAEGNPSRAQVWLMLQSLLEDRFRLKVHRETRTLPVYNLTAAKGGLKLAKPSAECAEAASRNTPLPTGQWPPGPCGYATVSFEPATGLALVGRQIDMTELVRALSGILQHAAADQTGFTGKFDVELRFAYEDDLTVGIGNPWPQANRPGDPAGSPSLFVALQQQLGIKSESAKGPVEVLVVDHAEKPTAN